MDLITQSGGFFQQLDGADGGSADGGSHGVGEQVGTAALTQQIHDGLTGSGVAAGSTAHGLAEGAGDDVHTAHNAAMLVGALAMLAHEAHSVAVVHHHEGIKLVSQVADGI